MKQLLLFILLCCWLSGFSQPGSVDTSFNSDVINYGAGPTGPVYKSALLSSDKIAIIGDFQTYNGFNRFTLAILNSDGSLDHSFNPDLTAGDHVTAFFAQPDGKFLAAGNITISGTRLTRICRFNADGSFDGAFDSSATIGFDGTVECLTLLPDGKIIGAGSFSNFESVGAPGIICLNQDGTRDTGFNASGSGFSTGANVLDSKTQADGKVILVGAFTTYNGSNRRNVVRINPDGSLDTGFTVGTGANAIVRTVALQSTGKILIGGDFSRYNNVTTERIARLNTNGTKDNTFSISSGSVQDSFGELRCLRVQQDDKVLATGDVMLGGALQLIRLTADGVVDSTFDPQSFTSVLELQTLEVQSTGKVIGYGIIDGNEYFNLFRRFNLDGSVDLTFNPFNGFETYPDAVKILADGRIACGGGFYQYREQSIYGFAMLKQNGDLDDSFHTPSGMEIVGAIEQQPDHKLLIRGIFSQLDGHPAPGIARLFPDGTVDTSFSPAISLFFDASLVLQPDGKIIVGDSVGLHRLNEDGSVDSNFTNPFSSTFLSSLALQPDGKLLISGTLNTGSGVLRLARLNSDGSIDNSFDIGNGPDQAGFIAVQPDSKILFGGNFTSFNGNAVNRLIRLNSDGSLDNSFDIGSGPNAGISSIVVQPNNKILLSGNFTLFNSTEQNRVARLLPNGAIDSGFDVGDGPYFPTAVQMALQADGKIVIGGSFIRFNDTSAMGIARLLGDPPAQNTIEISSVSATPLCAGQQATVNFIATGTFEADNVFTAELSDENGDFASSVEVGNLADASSGAIDILIPETTGPGTGYKIRVSASNPAITGSESAVFAISAPSLWYEDADGDGYGNPSVSMLSCNEPDDFVPDNSDCDDSSPTVYPGAAEIPFNGIDEDCNGTIDDGSQIFSQVLPSQCGTTLSAIGTTIGAVSFGSPVNGYRFKVVNNSDLSEQTIDRNSPNFQLTQLANYDYAATYTISVMLRRNGIWLNYYGPSCQVSTPAILDPGGAGAINPSQCGTTAASLSTLIATTSIPGVTQYRFRVTNLTDPLSPNAVQVIDRNLHWFSLSMLPSFNYGTDYGIEVAVKTNGAFSGFGSSCTVSSPGLPTLANCNSTIASTGTLISTSSLPYANSYRFELTNMTSGNFESVIVERPLNWFTFQHMPDFVPGAEYSVRISVKTSGSWSPYGETCLITAPGAARQLVLNGKNFAPTGFSAIAYPNPYADSFRIDLKSDSQKTVEIKIYDMTGRLVANEIAVSYEMPTREWGENLPTGVYSVCVGQGANLQTLRLVRR